MSLAETLGVERAVILHVDDLGLCHGGNRAYLELAAQGFVTCGSVMVPCPWFREIAEAAAAHPSLDLGVHLTLTSEWATYRWAPISTEELASGWRTAIEDLAAGVTHVALHAATPGEIEAISPQHAPWRTNEYALFRSGAVAGWCAERGIAAIGYCEIPQLWRGRSANVRWV